MSVKISGCGSYLPPRIVKNDFFSKNLEAYSREFQSFFNGSVERRHADAGMHSSYLSIEAAKAALKNSNSDASEIDLILCFSGFPDNLYPNEGNFIARALDMKVPSWSIDTACSSFITMLKCGSALIESGLHKKILIVATSHWVNRAIDQSKDFSCVGDGAGAIVLEKDVGSPPFLFKEFGDAAFLEMMSMKSPLVSKHQEYFTFASTRSSKEAVVLSVVKVAKELMVEAGIYPKDIDWFVFHQSGLNLIDLWCNYLEVPLEKCLHTFSTTANMSAANVPVILDEHYNRTKKIKRGDRILMFTPGAGFHSIASLINF